MRIGILTFHSQLNYGGVLQCWALQNALEKMGYDVVVIDRRLYAGPTMFDGIVPQLGLAGWAHLILRGLFMSGGLAMLQRCYATRRFVRQQLHLSSYHFYNWKDAPKNLGIDMVVVGSDQVWHCGDWGDPRPYLLEDAPPIPAIAYAASFGMEQLPEHISRHENGDSERTVTVFRQGLSRFTAISCREKEDVRVCEDVGFEAAHVVDPTLLDWDARTVDGEKPCRLVCYLMEGDVEAYWDSLEKFSRSNKCEVYVYLNSPFLSLPKSIPSLFKLPLRIFRKLFSRVRLMNDAGPGEFANSFKKAKWVISDSFHALMFSILNGCNVRMIKPPGGMRAKMFARISEIAAHMQGNVVMTSVADALASFDRNENVMCDAKWLLEWKKKSWGWLMDSVARATMPKAASRGC